MNPEVRKIILFIDKKFTDARQQAGRYGDAQRKMIESSVYGDMLREMFHDYKIKGETMTDFLRRLRKEEVDSVIDSIKE